MSTQGLTVWNIAESGIKHKKSSIKDNDCLNFHNSHYSIFIIRQGVCIIHSIMVKTFQWSFINKSNVQLEEASQYFIEVLDLGKAITL